MNIAISFVNRLCFFFTVFIRITGGLLFNDGAPYDIETSSLICSLECFLYDRDLRHERVNHRGLCQDEAIPENIY